MSTKADDAFRRHVFTVSDYYRMAQAGILRPEARVELIEGEIIDMPPIGSRHAGTIDHLSGILREQAAGLALVRVQHPVALSDYSEPEPDIALVQPRTDFYKSAHPGPDDVLLIIEVADTTLRLDRKIKAPLYARHGIPEYWVIDLERDELERYRDPHEVTYARIDRPDVSAPLALVAAPTLQLRVGAVFGD
jgi:Uma2 family endonuclease